VQVAEKKGVEKKDNANISHDIRVYGEVICGLSWVAAQSAGNGWVVYADESYLSFFPPLASIFSLPLHLRGLRPAWIPRKSLSNSLCLDTSKPVHLLRFHRNSSSKSNFTSGPLNKRNTIRV